ncbi:MAG TPA: ribokinase [Steroidobacter sp.]|uniref:ribokinase n=1 Tax=Steroidobacter sp. TaxID=1978227 RepID=UPI002ED9CBCF
MILVAGSANLDFVVQASHIPAPGETVLGRDFKTYPGGKGANQAIACARAGKAATQMLLALGDDPYSQPIEASLLAAGVQMHVVRVADQPTGTAFICVSDDAENAITVAPGANNALRPQHLPSLEGCNHLLLQLETPIDTVIAYARAARQRGVKVVLNAAPARALPAELLGLLDVLVVNKGELATVSAHEGSIEQCMERIDVPCIVVTLGDRGCCARVDGKVIMQDAFAVMPVDTTAAGDTFCGVLVAALDRGMTMAQALRWANAAGALACTRHGAQSSIPTHAELQTFLSQHP